MEREPIPSITISLGRVAALRRKGSLATRLARLLHPEPRPPERPRHPVLKKPDTPPGGLFSLRRSALD